MILYVIIIIFYRKIYLFSVFIYMYVSVHVFIFPSTTLFVQDLVPTVVSSLPWTVRPTQRWCPGPPAVASFTTTPRRTPLPSPTSRPAPPVVLPATSPTCAVGRATRSAWVDRDRTAPAWPRTGTGSVQVTDYQSKSLGVFSNSLCV